MLSKSTKIFIAVACLIFVGLVIQAAREAKEINTTNPSHSTKHTAEITGNPKLIQHLNEARQALADTASPGQPWGRIDDAKRSLLSIPKYTKEYDEAQRLMIEVQKKEEERGGVISVKKPSKNEMEIENLLSQVCLGNLKVSKFNWSKSGFGSVGILDSITIKNQGDKNCKDINAVIHFYAQSDTELGESFFAIYDKIPAGKTKTFRNINIGFLPSPVDQVRSANVVILGGMTY